ncbi:hypothetical protein QJS04_geneDACA023361 [Acorus gramineus]|uniref:RNase H type-1 domain-containing protein n=1 Tax=Acorus gramineus TaxID=55184 RepID=A0AAV9BPT0_ACOGR|nr:hypothetical protein QJS04_geneDACA023361 [Acorus gramineus]
MAFKFFDLVVLNCSSSFLLYAEKMKGFGLQKHFNGQSLLTWGPPSEVFVAAFIQDGMWCKLALWPSEFDYVRDEISQLGIGGCGSDILVWTGSKTAYIWTAILKSLKIPRATFIGNLCEDSSSLLSKACGDLFSVLLVQKTSITVQVKWSPPPIDWVKANSDGSLSEDRFGYGAITRNSSGDCIQTIAARTRAASINLLELKGILDELCLSKGNTSKVWSESDSTTAVAWAQGKGIFPWAALRDLREIKTLVALLTDWKISHVFREGNRVADVLAHWQSPLGSIVLSPNQMNHEIQKLVLEDKEGQLQNRASRPSLLSSTLS